MSDTYYDDPTPAIAEPRTGEVVPMPAEAPDFSHQQLQVGSSDMSFIMTAKKIVAPRKSLGQIRAALGQLCAANGDQYIYSWEVKDRANRREVTIEGLTVKAAMDLVRIYGNCFAGVIGVKDMGKHWLFQAAFVDLETGFNLRRDFLQRKGQATGMRDVDRQMDLVFQIGQSKAIRNVVLQANPSDAEFMMEESKKRIVAWVTNNKDKANEFIDRSLEEFNIALSRVEAVVGRVRKEWTVRDMARIMKELRGVHDGLTPAQDLYPSETDAAQVAAAKAAKKEKTPAKETGEATPKTGEAASAPVANEIARSDLRLEVEIPSITAFGARTKNALAKGDIKYVGSLVQKTSKMLLDLDGFGDKCLTEVRGYLAAHNLRLGMVLTGASASPEPADAPAESEAPAQASPEPTPEPEEADPAEPSAEEPAEEKFDFK